MRHTKLCFLIPASPNDGFCGQIAMFRRSLDRLGGIYRRAKIVAIFGDETSQELPGRWRPHFERIITHHVRPDEFAARYFAQAAACWSTFPSDCDLLVFADADTMVLRSIDDLLEQLIKAPRIAGTIAHWTPFHFQDEDPRETWGTLARECLGREIPLDYTHTLTLDRDPPSQRECPFYINYGFVIAPPKLIEQIRATYFSLWLRIPQLLRNPHFAGQVSLTLAIYAHNVLRYSMDIRYNFPNDEIAERLHPESLQDLRVIHYLRTHRFDRQQIFASAEEFDSFLKLDLRGSDKIFQDHIRDLTDSRYPF